MKGIGDCPSVVTMQAGGNNAGFYDVASNCIFHDQDKVYRPAFPEKGECTDAMDRSMIYLTTPNKDGNWLEYDVIKMIQEIFDNDPTKSNPDFRLYVIGYAHFFDVRDGATMCNDFSLTLPWKWDHKENLVMDLRKQINNLTNTLNQGLKRAVENFGNDKIGYIDVTRGFDGGRFCEAGHSQWEQFFGNKVLMWNWLGSIITKLNGEKFEREPTQEFDHWLQTGAFTDDPNEVTGHDGEIVIDSPRQCNNADS
jgi:hypothetical protein